MIYPLLRLFVGKVLMPTGKMALTCESFLAMCRLLDEFVALKRGRSTKSAVLPLLQAHLEMHQRAHGVEYIRPKHHFGFHNVLDSSDDKVWLDCSVHERKHQIVKQAADAIKNTSSYEASVLGRVLVTQLRQLENTKKDKTLIGNTGLHAELSQQLGSAVHLGKSLLYRDTVIGVGDVLLFHGEGGIVRACGEHDSKLFVLLQLCRRDGFCTFGATTLRPQGEALHLLYLDSVRESFSLAFAWAWASDSTNLLVLHGEGDL